MTATIDFELSRKIKSGELELIYARHDKNGRVYCTFRNAKDSWIDKLPKLESRHD